MPAHGDGFPAALRKLLRAAGFNRKPALKHVVHELRVKGALAAGRVGAFQPLRDSVRAADQNPVPADAPEEELNQSFEVAVIRVVVLAVDNDGGLARYDPPARRFHGDGHWALCLRFEGVHPRPHRDKAMIEFRQVFEFKVDSQIPHSASPLIAVANALGKRFVDDNRHVRMRLDQRCGVFRVQFFVQQQSLHRFGFVLARSK